MARSGTLQARGAGPGEARRARRRARAPRPTTTRDPAGTRARILGAATQEFARFGHGGARVDRIAGRAGANKRMLYYYFGDKDALFLAVLEHAYASIRSAEEALHLLDTPPVTAVERLVEFTWRYSLEHPELLTLLYSANLHRARRRRRSKDIRAMNSPLIATLREVLRRGEGEGVFRRGVDPLQLYISIAGLAYFYLSNNYSLSQVFDRDLAAPGAREARLAHMTELVTGFLTTKRGIWRERSAQARRLRAEQFGRTASDRRAATGGEKVSDVGPPQRSALAIRLPTADRRMEPYTLSAPRDFPAQPANPFNRVALAAPHVVADPLSANDPWVEAAVDWERTIAFRRHLWALGFGVAEAMDTAQRGTGLDGPASLELIRRSIDAAREVPGALLASGAGTDRLEPGPRATVNEVIAAYERQFEAIERLGGRIIMRASRALAACTKSPDDYYRVYTKLLQQAREPVIIHWLGEMFDPALAGYWGYEDHHKAVEVALVVIQANAAKIDGVRVSLLDKQKEIDMRRRLPQGVRMYTGDDFNYAELIEGDGEAHSDALLGIFDAIAPAASGALAALARGDRKRFHEILAPTVPLSRHIFGGPTRFCETGVVFLAWLNGHQEHFVMVGGQQSARHILHLAEAFRLADRAGLLRDPEAACRRMRQLLALQGLEG